MSVNALLAQFSRDTRPPKTRTICLVLSSTSVVKYREEKSKDKSSTAIGFSCP